MNNKLFIGILFGISLGFLAFNPVFAQTVRLVPQSVETDLNSDFSITLDIESVTDLFGIAFDLSFDPSLVNFVSAEKGGFMSSDGCETSLMVSESQSGNLIVGLARMGSEFGGISGTGTLMTFNFVSLNKTGTNNFSFSNNSLCIFSETGCDYQTGSWIASNVIIGSYADVSAPVLSDGLPTGQLSSGTTQTTLSLTTNEDATCRYTTNSGVSYDSIGSTFSTTGGTSHSVSLLNISDGNIYNYYIKCKDSAGNKNNSDYVISFSVATAAPVQDTQAPTVPVNLAASVISGSQINLSWSASTDNIGIYCYHIHRNESLIDSVTGTSYSNTGLSSGSSYSYTVSALDAAGNESAQSNPVSATTQTAEDPPADEPEEEDPPADEPEEEDSTIRELQNRIAELLSQIQALQTLLAQMTGTSNIPTNFKFSKTLKMGYYSDEVRYLQIFLNSDSYTKIAFSGPGSPGNETKY